ncbi:MAG: NAD(P)-dependent alcohol dehydrogenase [Sinimarinibacterium sp.]
MGPSGLTIEGVVLSNPASMRAWVWRAFGSCDGLRCETRALPQPGRGDVLVRMRANSLNQRDVMAMHGTLPRGAEALGRIPLSDGAGDVVAVGEGVHDLKPGDRVVGLFFPRWQAGALRSEYAACIPGGTVDGMLVQYAVLPESAALRFPDHLSPAEAATLPCAAVTAWCALWPKSGLQPGETVLVLGTGGVAVFTLQLAKAAGARVIVTTSSDERGERMTQLGADGVINYRRHPQWHQDALALTGGAGADVVVETGGAGTYLQSLKASALNGRVALVGIITGLNDPGGSFATILTRNLTVRAVQPGSRTDLEALLRFVDAVRLRPVIDSVHRFDDVHAAYRRLDSGQAFGKVVVTHDL